MFVNPIFGVWKFCDEAAILVLPICVSDGAVFPPELMVAYRLLFHGKGAPEDAPFVWVFPGMLYPRYFQLSTPR